MTVKELWVTPRVILNKYIEKLPGLTAEYELMMTRASSYHALSESDQKKQWEELRKRMPSPRHKAVHRPETQEEWLAGLAAYGVPLRLVDSEGKPVDEEG
jgi:hypothetical protein